ncbi:phospholipase domain-containing protein [Amycolatopsis sp. NPDC005961]|uniref:phospholipase domain-containing protein n=1 Tax=Amycolatopsis sp. NPDC005961 TaxID=3156720 RepID=UPI00340FC321
MVPPYAAAGQSTVDTTGEIFAGSATNPAGPYGLGQRVPMLVVSPWSKGGYVCSETFDHTSIIRFIERRFGVREPNITPWRRSVCGDLTSAFDFARTDVRVPALPDTAGYEPPDRVRHPDYVPAVPANNVLPKQERGLRPARALPYDLSADARLAGGTLTVTFASHGRAGATFYVVTPSGEPRTYTAAAGTSLPAALPAAGAYDYTAYGPNGFVRQFRGTAAGPEVSLRQDGAELALVLTNSGTTTVQLKVTDAYGRCSSTHRLRPGARVVEHVDTRHSNNWYDVSVSSDRDPKFLRRLAGHGETGRPSTSDPATLTK